MSESSHSSVSLLMHPQSDPRLSGKPPSMPRPPAVIRFAESCRPDATALPRTLSSRGAAAVRGAVLSPIDAALPDDAAPRDSDARRCSVNSWE